ncbi:MAG: hypothetical protein JNL39_04900 [Opitutaceae bacterium]|nr:hypothetical protein [Opitutaceae bacterium]
MRPLLFVLTAAASVAAEEIVIDFERAEIGKPVPTWSDKGVVFSLASAPVNSKAVGRVMFFLYISTDRKGILNAMANEQAVPLQAKLPRNASSVTLVLWGSTGCAAKLQAFDANDQLVDEAAVAIVPGRKSPAEPVPQFTLRVQAPAIAYIRLSGPRNGEFLAADEMRFVPSAAP